MLLILFYLFIAVIAIHFFFFILVFGKFSFAKNLTSSPKNFPISVIVCAKNQEENVAKYIPILAEQEYPNFEIVLIDDASSDNTLEVFEAFEKQYSNIKLVKVQNNEAFWGNKKFALTLGIKAAKNDYLLFTDADCYPKTNQWIAEMSAHFTTQNTIILGYGAYEKIKGSFLNKFIRFETLLTATSYFSWTKIGKPYMGEGRNMAYKRQEFFRTNGFINHIKIRFGSDKLFINEAANQNNTTICYSPQSFTYSKSTTTFKDWFLEQRRHLVVAQQYKFFDKAQLTVFYISQILFFILSIILLSFHFQWIIVLIIIGLRYLFSWISIGYAASKLQEKDLIVWFPIIELPLLIIQVYVYLSNLFSKPSQWK